MDESGGSAQPRSGNDEPTEHATGATTPAADPGTPEPKHDDTPHNGTERPIRNHENPGTSSKNDTKPTTSPEPATPDHSGTPVPSGTTQTDRNEPGPPSGPTASDSPPSTSPAPQDGLSAPGSDTPTIDSASPSTDSAPHDGPLAPASGAPSGDSTPPDDTSAGTSGTPSTSPAPHDGLSAPGSGTPFAGSAPHEAAPASETGTQSADSAADNAPSTPVSGTPSTSPTPHADTDTATGTPDKATAPHDTPHADRAPDRPHAHTEPHAHTGAPTPPDARPGGTAMPKGRPPQRPKEPGGGLLMGRPFGVPVYVAPSWFLVAALITWVFGGQLDRVLPELGAARYLVALFFAVAFYGSVLVHELAHTVAALRFKLPVRRIQLQFFGGVSEIEKEAETPGREFVLAFVGPLLSLILSGIFYLAMQPVEPGTVPGVLLAGLMVSNLIVAAFNLLPGLPLDGGRMLRAVVWKITGRPMSGTIAAAWVGRALAVSVLIGLPLLTQTGALGTNTEDISGMDTVTDALLAAILAAIIWTGAGNSLRMARLREHLPDLRARNLTRRAVPVETNTPLSEALRRANAAGARALVVVDADGQPLSLVREAAIVGVPEHRRPWVSVSGLAQDLTDGMRVSAELAGEDLLDTLRATPATEYLVVEETGEIYGVLSAADVERAFVKAMARPN
ncbi:site-2 protease family protein [Streptomyces sp. STR69]|uniref:site-2 protease family protein n=1 Tax=Streptomyces sp. STR69 TaxID=1796942 RepID=UPI0021C95C2D|nr:site-2 protease family protein [Streptomyces sp. STR69]